MEREQDICFHLFILYFRHKIQKLTEKNISNVNISIFLNLINEITEQNTPLKIRKLHKRFLK
jgi:hypothetical protein